MTKWINRHYFWINPFLIFITTISSAFLTYSFPEDFSSQHPARFQLFNPLLEYIIPIFGISAFMLTTITIIEIVNKKTIKKLEEENEQYKILSETISENIKELFDGFLYKFATIKADLENSERVTLYVHNGDNSFIPFGRYSQNTKYSKSGRSKYPDNEGCIAKGWEKTWYFDNEFPLDSKDYLNKNKDEYNIDNKVMKKLNMQSKLYAVLRLDVLEKPMAVIVVESTNPTKFSEKKVKKILMDQQDYLATMIAGLEQYIHKPSNAISIEEELDG